MIQQTELILKVFSIMIRKERAHHDHQPAQTRSGRQGQYSSRHGRQICQIPRQFHQILRHPRAGTAKVIPSIRRPFRLFQDAIRRRLDTMIPSPDVSTSTVVLELDQAMPSTRLTKNVRITIYATKRPGSVPHLYCATWIPCRRPLRPIAMQNYAMNLMALRSPVGKRESTDV